MTDWFVRFMDLARHVAQWSKDPSTKVGCVIVNADRIVVAMGYNGFPRGVNDITARYKDREQKYQYVVHAEINAVLNASASVKGATAYVTSTPCDHCAAVMIQAGIKNVVTLKPAVPIRYKVEAAEAMFREAGVKLHTIDA